MDKNIKDKHCKDCFFWEKDRGVFCMIGGWSGDHRDNGNCMYEPKSIPKQGNSKPCHSFLEK